ncbi:MAG: hypothetical protein ACLFNP_06745 [Spirochaetaceae bacterium]
MSTRSRLWLLVALIGVLSLAGCESPTTPDTGGGGGGGGGGGSGDGVSESEAAQVASGAMSAVSTAVSEALAEGISGQSASTTVSSSALEPAATYDVNYSGAGVTVTGSMSSSESGSDFSYTLTVTLNSYSSSAGAVTGSLTVQGNFDGAGYTGSYDGAFAVSSGGTNYTVELSWTLDGSGQFSGEYSVNGSSFTYTGGTGDDTGDGDGGEGEGEGDAGTTGVSVWTSVGEVGNVYVYINGSYRGTLSSHFPSGSPQYGQAGTITVSLSPGTHTIRADTDTESYWPEASFTLNSGDQLLYQLGR